MNEIERKIVEAGCDFILDAVYGETRCGNCKWWDDTEMSCNFEGEDETNCFEKKDGLI